MQTTHKVSKLNARNAIFKVKQLSQLQLGISVELTAPQATHTQTHIQGPEASNIVFQSQSPVDAVTNCLPNRQGFCCTLYGENLFKQFLSMLHCSASLVEQKGGGKWASWVT